MHENNYISNVRNITMLALGVLLQQPFMNVLAMSMGKQRTMGKRRKQRKEDKTERDILLSRFTQSDSSNMQRAGEVEPQTNSEASGVRANADGTITIKGVSIGPFLGEWQGVMRNKIIAERLVDLTEADKKNTDIQIQGDGVRIVMGDIEFVVSSADAAGMALDGAQGMSKPYAAALNILGKLGAEPPPKSLSEERGELALKQAQQTYLEGREVVGAGSWETRGSNSGPLIDEINQANHSGSGLEWCGMYVGHAYKKAGIRPEILRSLVFWSGYRLHLFFTRGVDVQNKAVGSFWQPHTYANLPVQAGEKRKEALDSFAPRAGDIVLFRSDYSHVAMVSSYNSETGVLELMEGNSGNKVQATAFGSDAGQITFVGRFNASDYGGEVEQELIRAPQPNVVHNDRRSGRTS